jgi:hypothetical protein
MMYKRIKKKLIDKKNKFEIIYKMEGKQAMMGAAITNKLIVFLHLILVCNCFFIFFEAKT